MTLYIQSSNGDKALEKYTPFTPGSRKVIWRKIEEIKHRGYAVSIQERYSYTAGVAAPCFIDQRVIGSIAIIGPAERIKAMGIEKTGKTVKRIADQLSTAARTFNRPTIWETGRQTIAIGQIDEPTRTTYRHSDRRRAGNRQGDRTWFGSRRS